MEVEQCDLVICRGELVAEKCARWPLNRLVQMLLDSGLLIRVRKRLSSTFRLIRISVLACE